MERKLLLKISCIVMLALFSFAFTSGYSQNIEVKGTVTDSVAGTTLVGVNIVQKGTTNGVVSDVYGKFSLSVPKGSSIIFSYIGYASRTITIESNETLNIKLRSTQVDLEELIVIGYATQKKTDKTGAVSMVKADELNGGVLTDPIQAMQGKAAGVSVTKKGGDPNEGFAVRIRGASGFGSNTQPLFVIDGIAGADPTIISPNDIASYNILKDAASTAIYGSRGANGVVIITTKKGNAGGKNSSGNYSNIEFNSQISFDRIAKKVDLLTANQIREFAKKINDTTTRDGGTNTDWQDAIYRIGMSTSNNLSLSGGNSTTSYHASFGRSNWEGVMKGTSKQRTNAAFNIDHKALKDKLTISGGILTSFENNDYENYGGWGQEDIIYQALTRNPTDPIYNPDGSYFKSSRVFNYENPISIINEVTNNREARKFLGNIKTDLEVFKGFVTSVNFGYISDNNNTNYFRPSGLFASADNGFSKKQLNNTTEKLVELTATYTKTIAQNHNINFLGGYSWQEKMNSGFFAQGRDAQSQLSGPDNLMVMNNVVWGDINSWRGKSNLIGFFGRAQYNYNSKYYVSGSLRRDGSSKFGSNHKWGWFPTAAVGWNIDKENFIKDIKWINQLKLRGSYGISGNQEIGEYRSMVMWVVDQQTIDPESGQKIITFKPAWNANPDLKWEQTSEVNVGIDFAVLDNKFSGSFEFYRKVTNDLLGEYTVTKPPNLAPRTFANTGSMSNVGQELFIQYFAITHKNFSWKTSATFAHNKTEILDLGSYFNEKDGVRKEGYISARGMVSDGLYVTGIMVGEEIGAFYVPTYVTIQGGKFVYESAAGGYTTDLSQAKRTIIGSAAPKLELGWSNSFTFYKRWSVEMAFRAMIGNKVYNATKMVFDDPGNIPNLNGNPDAITWYDKGLKQGSFIADIYVEDASFLKLDYFSIVYDFKLTKTQNWITNLKVFASANNLFTLTGYSGVDPETKMDGLSFGIDLFNVYPKTRSVTFGIKANF